MLPDTPEFAERTAPALLPELMDGPSTYEDFRDCVRDLGQVNRLTRGYAPTLDFLERIATLSNTRGLHIVDVGSGGGDTLRTIARWADRKKLDWRFTGIDLNPHATRAAQEFSQTEPSPARSSSSTGAIQWLTADVFSYEADDIDVVLSSLMTHHLSDSEIVRFITWMEKNARLGWFVNDLYRSRDSYHLFRLLSSVARWHRFVRHDGPVSIRRAFREADWQRLCITSGVSTKDVRIEKYFPARLCVSRIK